MNVCNHLAINLRVQKTNVVQRTGTNNFPSKAIARQIARSKSARSYFYHTVDFSSTDQGQKRTGKPKKSFCFY